MPEINSTPPEQPPSAPNPDSAPKEPLPVLTGFSDAAWTPPSSGITALMPHAEVEAYAALYAQSHLINQENSAYWTAVSNAL